MINVSRAVNDKRLNQPILRIVQTESFNDYGESVIKTLKTHHNAVVSVPTNAELIRWVDNTTYKKAMCFTSSLIFNPDNLQGQPDILVWKGDEYLIVSVDDYSHNGYTRAIGVLQALQVAKDTEEYSTPEDEDDVQH